MFPQYFFFLQFACVFLCKSMHNLFSEEVVSDNNPVVVLYVYVCTCKLSNLIIRPAALYLQPPQTRPQGRKHWRQNTHSCGIEAIFRYAPPPRTCD